MDVWLKVNENLIFRVTFITERKLQIINPGLISGILIVQLNVKYIIMQDIIQNQMWFADLKSSVVIYCILMVQIIFKPNEPKCIEIVWQNSNRQKNYL